LLIKGAAALLAEAVLHIATDVPRLAARLTDVSIKPVTRRIGHICARFWRRNLNVTEHLHYFTRRYKESTANQKTAE
jgi:hypothetical protein